MCHRPLETAIQLDQNLLDYIDNTITAKVTEKINSAQKQLEQTLAQCRGSAASQVSRVQQ